MVWRLAQSANRPDFEPSLSTQVLKVRYTISEPSHLVTLVPDPTVATLLIMTEVRAYSFTNHSLSTVRGCTNPSKRNSPVYPHDSPISEEVLYAPSYCGARPLMFRSISLISIHRRSPVPINEASQIQATDVRHVIMKASNARYEGSLNLLVHTYLM